MKIREACNCCLNRGTRKICEKQKFCNFFVYNPQAFDTPTLKERIKGALHF